MGPLFMENGENNAFHGFKAQNGSMSMKRDAEMGHVSADEGVTLLMSTRGQCCAGAGSEEAEGS